MAIVLLQLLILVLDMNFLLTQITMSLYYTIVIVGLCMLMGYAGQISMGHAGFFAIGAYTQAFLVTVNLGPADISGFPGFLKSAGLLIARSTPSGEILSFSPWIAFVAVIIITVFFALDLGIPILRLKGHYLAMATLAFGIMIYTFVLAVDFLGMADGIAGIPPFQMFPGIALSGDMSARIPNYYIAAVVLIIVVTVAVNIINSRVGRALKAIHGNQLAAESLGINASRYKLGIFVFSAVTAAVAGAMLAHYNGSIGPSEATINKSVRFVSLVAVGGMDSIWGVVGMGFCLQFISLRGVFGSFDEAFFALILVITMLFLPRGIIRVEYFKSLVAWIRRLLKK